MSIDKHLFQEALQANDLPIWECPYCEKAPLKLPKGGITINETPTTLYFRDHPDHEPEWDKGFFTGKLICSNSQCNEIIYVNGEAEISVDGVFDLPEAEGGDSGPVYTYGWYLKPKHFSSPINVIKIHRYYPKIIFPFLLKSFSLLWVDSASCANKIRTVVEKILDDRKIKKYTIKDGKRKPIALHHRIDLFRKVNPEAGHFFEAVKWIGNMGSHSDDSKLTRADLLAAFEMVEHTLELIYNIRSKELKKIATAIIKRKGPVPKKKIIYNNRF